MLELNLSESTHRSMAITSTPASSSSRPPTPAYVGESREKAEVVRRFSSENLLCQYKLNGHQLVAQPV